MKATICVSVSPAVRLAGGASANSDFIEFRDGCWISSQLSSQETLTWSGECKESFAHGVGKTVWRSENRAGDVDEITFEGELSYGVPQGGGKLT